MRSSFDNVNFYKLEALLSSMPRKSEIIFVTETWIKPQSLRIFFNLSGCNFDHDSRPDCKEGEVTFCVGNSIKFHVTDEPTTTVQENLFESAFINFAIQN